MGTYQGPCFSAVGPLAGALLFLLAILPGTACSLSISEILFSRNFWASLPGLLSLVAIEMVLVSEFGVSLVFLLGAREKSRSYCCFVWLLGVESWVVVVVPSQTLKVHSQDLRELGKVQRKTFVVCWVPRFNCAFSYHFAELLGGDRCSMVRIEECLRVL